MLPKTSSRWRRPKSVAPSRPPGSNHSTDTIQDDPLDARATLLEPRGLTLVSAVDLHVMLNLACLLQVRLEPLPPAAVACPTTRTAAASVAPVRFE